jgi:Flp pilus assembly protein TadB
VIVSVVIALVVGLVFYVAYSFFERKASGQFTSRHARNVLKRIENESYEQNAEYSDAQGSIVRQDAFDSGMMRLLRSLPNGDAIATTVIKAGFGQKPALIVLGWLVLLVGLAYGIGSIPALTGAKAFVMALLASLYITFKYLTGKVRKRNAEFLDKFPDVLDMIVRSVKSGIAG